MSISDILNLSAIIIIPIAAVIIGQYLQNCVEKRKDKMEIFKTLMISRNGWTVESVRALNIIDIVFADDRKVRAAWRDLYDKYSVDNPDYAHLEKIRQAQFKLIETMAVSLGYKNKITWETIQNPYVPKGMVEAAENQKLFEQGQLEFVKAAELINAKLRASEAGNRNEENQNGSNE